MTTLEGYNVIKFIYNDSFLKKSSLKYYFITTI